MRSAVRSGTAARDVKKREENGEQRTEQILRNGETETKAEKQQRHKKGKREEREEKREKQEQRENQRISMRRERTCAVGSTI